MNKADIDIDLPDRDRLIKLLNVTAARLPATDGRVKKHNSGVYPQNIPFDPINNCASLDYHEAEERGYFKIDLLNQTVYKGIRDYEHYERLLSTEPDWKKLWQDKVWSSNLIHIGNYTDLLVDMKPDSIPRMAAFISIIRPGKAHLQRKPWKEVFENVWDRDNSKGYTFKKSHALAHGTMVALHMNILDGV